MVDMMDMFAGVLPSCRCIEPTLSWWAVWPSVVHGERWTYARQDEGNLVVSMHIIKDVIKIFINFKCQVVLMHIHAS